MKNFIAQISIHTLFFVREFEKFNISSFINLILIFSVNLPAIFIYKFLKIEIQLQPPGDSREHGLCEVL